MEEEPEATVVTPIIYPLSVYHFKQSVETPGIWSCDILLSSFLLLLFSRGYIHPCEFPAVLLRMDLTIQTSYKTREFVFNHSLKVQSVTRKT